MTTTTKTSARVMATDEKTGRRYVKTQTVEGATVTVTRFVGEEVGGTYRWASALYDVTSPAGELFARAVKWDGQHWKVGSKVAPSLTKAVRAVLGIEQLAEPKAAKPSTRKPRAKKTGNPRADRAAADAASGGSVIDKDPETGLPRIKPEYAAKAEQAAADQAARNAG